MAESEHTAYETKSEAADLEIEIIHATDNLPKQKTKPKPSKSTSNSEAEEIVDVASSSSSSRKGNAKWRRKLRRQNKSESNSETEEVMEVSSAQSRKKQSPSKSESNSEADGKEMLEMFDKYLNVRLKNDSKSAVEVKGRELSDMINKKGKQNEPSMFISFSQTKEKSIENTKKRNNDITNDFWLDMLKTKPTEESARQNVQNIETVAGKLHDNKAKKQDDSTKEAKNQPQKQEIEALLPHLDKTADAAQRDIENQKYKDIQKPNEPATKKVSKMNKNPFKKEPLVKNLTCEGSDKLSTAQDVLDGVTAEKEKRTRAENKNAPFTQPIKRTTPKTELNFELQNSPLFKHDPGLLGLSLECTAALKDLETINLKSEELSSPEQGSPEKKTNKTATYVNPETVKSHGYSSTSSASEEVIMLPYEEETKKMNRKQRRKKRQLLEQQKQQEMEREREEVQLRAVEQDKSVKNTKKELDFEEQGELNSDNRSTEQNADDNEVEQANEGDEEQQFQHDYEHGEHEHEAEEDENYENEGNCENEHNDHNEEYYHDEDNEENENDEEYYHDEHNEESENDEQNYHDEHNEENEDDEENEYNAEDEENHYNQEYDDEDDNEHQDQDEGDYDYDEHNQQYDEDEFDNNNEEHDEEYDENDDNEQEYEHGHNEEGEENEENEHNAEEYEDENSYNEEHNAEHSDKNDDDVEVSSAQSRKMVSPSKAESNSESDEDEDEDDHLEWRDHFAPSFRHGSIETEEEIIEKVLKRKKDKILKRKLDQEQHNDEIKKEDEELPFLISMSDSDMDHFAEPSCQNTDVAIEMEGCYTESVASAAYKQNKPKHNTTTDSEGPLPGTTTSDDNYVCIAGGGSTAHTSYLVTGHKMKTKKLEHKINLIAAIEAATSSSTSSAEEESGVEAGTDANNATTIGKVGGSVVGASLNFVRSLIVSDSEANADLNLLGQHNPMVASASAAINTTAALKQTSNSSAVQHCGLKKKTKRRRR